MKVCVITTSSVILRKFSFVLVPNVRDYRNRKGGFGIVVLAGCDADCKFVFAVTKHAGSTNDVIVWEDSELCQAIKVR